MNPPSHWRLYEQGHTPTGGTRTLWAGRDDVGPLWRVMEGLQEVCTTSDRAHAVEKYEGMR